MKGTYQYIRKLWKSPKASLGQLWKEKLMKFRREPATVRLDHPSRLDRARQAGYKAKQGIFVVRQKVMRGSHKRPDWAGGRKTKQSMETMMLKKNYQAIAEERAAKAFSNCEALNSYFVAKDGKNYWYEVIIVDRSHPAIVADKSLGWISNSAHKSRASRGLTSSGRRYRGLLWKGQGAEKARPSRHANIRRKVNR